MASEDEWNNQGPKHTCCNNDDISKEKDDAPNQNTTKGSNTPRRVEIDLTEEAIDDKGIWEDLAVIARIIGPKKSRRIINPWIKNNWDSQTVVKFLLKGFFVAIFTEKGIRDQILSSKSWYFENFSLYIQPWTPNFNPLKLTVYETPVWIKLYNLPIEYWGDSSLEKIGCSRKEDKEKAIWLKKVNEQKQKPPKIKPLLDARMHPEPNPQPCQVKSEINNVEGAVIPSQILFPMPGSQAVNIAKECTSDTEGSSSDREGEDDVLDSLDPRCISQSANTLLGRAKGVKGRKSHK
ncbi:hypothetical protein SUGI_0726750 [Cryptomeria japonica]|nr:hypothetical protein SUGI_0726750 [Cryptomeria japonica]